MARSVRHPLFARFYSRVVVPGLVREGGDDLRRRLLAGLGGTVVEVGAGDGANFDLYPAEVQRLLAVEPEPYLRDRAAAQAASLGAPQVELLDAVASALPMADGEADAVVFSLVLCSVDQRAALAEARRVLRPGGQLRFLEHVRAHEQAGWRTQRVLDATVWPLVGGGCHLSRDTVGAIERAGFTITELDRFRFPTGSRGPSSSLVLGGAVPA